MSACAADFGTTAARNLSASSGSAFCSSGLDPSAWASDAERPQLLLDAGTATSSAADLPLDRLREALGDLGVAALSVDLLGEGVEHRRQLHHLAVARAAR